MARVCKRPALPFGLGLIGLLLGGCASMPMVLPEGYVRVLLVHHNRFYLLPQEGDSEARLRKDSAGLLNFGTFDNWLAVSRPVDSLASELKPSSEGGQRLFFVVALDSPNTPGVKQAESTLLEAGHLCPTASANTLPGCWVMRKEP